MDLRLILKTEALKDLSTGTLESFPEYCVKNGKIFLGLQIGDVVDDKEMDKSLEQRVINQARSDYNLMTSGEEKANADNCMYRRDCLAYALQKNEFSKHEINNIPFDHGHTIKSYVERYQDTQLIEGLRNLLLNSGVVMNPINFNTKNLLYSHIQDIMSEKSRNYALKQLKL